MPVNPITLDKIEPVVIKQVEYKVIDRIVHEIKGAEIQKDNKKREEKFNKERQKKASEKFSFFLTKFNLKFEYSIEEDSINFKIKDDKGSVIFEGITYDIEDLLDRVKKNTGSIIDVKG